MKKNQVNSILVNQTKRRNTVFAFVSIIIIVFLLAITLFMVYTQRNKADYITYSQKSNINYNVQYKQNDFFDKNTLESNRQYIAGLIDKITADFDYNISLEDDSIEYKYAYRVESNVSVKDKDTGNLFYDKTEVLVPERERQSSQKDVDINESITINYDHYNNVIKRFVSVYDLKNATSTLNINMYVNVIGSCEEFSEYKGEEKVITLSIPLTEDTIAINFEDNIINTTNNVMKCTDSSGLNFIILFMGVVLSISGVALIIALVLYEYKTRTAETIYEKSVKKILNNYGSCIQMIGNEFEFKEYQLLKIDNFTDMLEISDKLRQPILMKENPEKTGAYFVIPSSTKLLYVYRLKVSDIEKEINKKVSKDLEEADL